MHHDALAGQRVMFMAAVDSTAHMFVAPIAAHVRELGAHTTLVVGGGQQFDVSSEFDQVIRLPEFRRRGPGQLLRARRELQQAVARSRPDLMHLHTPFAILLGRQAAAKESVPAISVIHGTALGVPGVGGKAFAAVESQQAALCHHYIVLNKEDDASYRHFAPRSRVVLAPCGGAGLATPFAERAKARPHDRPPRVLFLGRPAPSKRLAVLFDAWALAREAIPDLELRIVGPTAPGDRATAVPSAPGVTIIGDFVPPVPELTRADLLATASSREGFPMTATEALALGVPVVSTANRGIRRVAEWVESGLTITASDAQSLAAGMLRGLDLRVRLTPAARNDWSRPNVLEFHAEQIAAALAT